MVFTVLGAVAELERSLIVERVKAGLRNARAKGKRLGWPSRDVDAATVAMLRSQGASWRTISTQLGVGLPHCIVLPEGVPELGKRIWERNRRHDPWPTIR